MTVYRNRYTGEVGIGGLSSHMSSDGWEEERPSTFLYKGPLWPYRHWVYTAILLVIIGLPLYYFLRPLNAGVLVTPRVVNGRYIYSAKELSLYSKLRDTKKKQLWLTGDILIDGGTLYDTAIGCTKGNIAIPDGVSGSEIAVGGTLLVGDAVSSRLMADVVIVTGTLENMLVRGKKIEIKGKSSSGNDIKTIP
jgi:hypothetical protein